MVTFDNLCGNDQAAVTAFYYKSFSECQNGDAALLKTKSAPCSHIIIPLSLTGQEKQSRMKEILSVNSIS